MCAMIRSSISLRMRKSASRPTWSTSRLPCYVLELAVGLARYLAWKEVNRHPSKPRSWTSSEPAPPYGWSSLQMSAASSNRPTVPNVQLQLSQEHWHVARLPGRRVALELPVHIAAQLLCYPLPVLGLDGSTECVHDIDNSAVAVSVDN